MACTSRDSRSQGDRNGPARNSLSQRVRSTVFCARSVIAWLECVGPVALWQPALGLFPVRISTRSRSPFGDDLARLGPPPTVSSVALAFQRRTGANRCQHRGPCAAKAGPGARSSKFRGGSSLAVCCPLPREIARRIGVAASTVRRSQSMAAAELLPYHFVVPVSCATHALRATIGERAEAPPDSGFADYAGFSGPFRTTADVWRGRPWWSRGDSNP
jgi:hypothetical protein